MAVTVDDGEQLLDDTGDTYIVPTAGTNPLLLSFWLASDNSSSPGTTTHTIGGQAFEGNDGQATTGGFSPFFKSDAHWTTSNGDWPTTGSQTVVLTNTQNLANEGGIIVSLAGVHQTTPIKDFQGAKDENVTAFPSFTISALDGDMIYWIGSCANAQSITAPNAPGTNSWTATSWINDTAIVGGGMAKGSVYRMSVTQDISSQAITGGLSAQTGNAACSIVVIGQSTGGAASNPKGPLGMPLHVPFRGPLA